MLSFVSFVAKVVFLTLGLCLALIVLTPQQKEAPNHDPVANVDPPPRAASEWAGADFPSSDWEHSSYDWYIQWKRVRKYARISYKMGHVGNFPALRRQAHALYEQTWRWPDGPERAACRPAASALLSALEAFIQRDAGATVEYLALDDAGQACLAAAQKAKFGR